ncbi:Multidrug-efflux transporter 3 [Afipia felis]|uniref:Multidrug-efflux transporter 3 n=1 Tax=Afipia felis TaxID=1035 RepID=A0A090N7E9_AFIFE|nr:MDR family MFS transporter [Afipia felis]CEG08483.1 Multidrug-efflux transporter 3 [Afipia felis]
MSKIQRPEPEMEGEPLAPDDLAAITGEAIRIEDSEPAIRASLPHSEALPIVLSLLCNLFLTALDQTIVATALPTIGVQFHDVSNLSWVITAYLLASTAVAPVYGALADIYGRRAMIITANVLFLIGSVLCALAPNLLFLILARGLQGLGGGGILPLVQTLIADVITPRDRGRYQGYISMVWVTAGIGGPVLGGVFAQHLHWSMIFWINLPIGVGSLMLLLPRLRKISDYHRHRKLDWAGGLLLMASAVVFLLGLTWGGHKFAWLSPTILAMMGAAVVLMAAFVIHARTHDEPFLPLPLISGSVVPYSMVAGGCAMGAMIGMIVHLPIYYESVYRLSASEAGIALIPLVAVSVLGAWSAGQFMAVTGRYKWAAVGGASVATGCLLLMALLAAPPLWVLLSLLAVLALGIGTCFPISVVSIQNAVPRSQVGTATGAMNFFRALMSSFAVAMFTAILLAAVGQEIPIGEGMSGNHNLASDDMIVGFRFVFLAAAFLMATAAVLFALMEERPLAGSKPSPAATMAE